MGILDSVVSGIKHRVTSDVSYGVGGMASDAIMGKIKGAGKKGGKCPQCGAKITESGLAFCKKCGYKLTVTCPACQITYPTGTNVCGKCGKGLPKPQKIDRNWKKKLK